MEKAVPRFITSCLLGEPLTVHRDGSAARDWMYVDDHCDALDRLLHVSPERVVGQVINLGTGQHLSVLEVAQAVREAMQADTPIEFVGDRPGQVFRHTSDSSRARALLGWESNTPFSDGLRRTINWYRDNEAWWRPQMWMRRIPIITAAGRRELH